MRVGGQKAPALCQGAGKGKEGSRREPGTGSWGKDATCQHRGDSMSAVKELQLTGETPGAGAVAQQAQLPLGNPHVILECRFKSQLLCASHAASC